MPPEAAAAETQEQIDARLAEEAAMSGDDYQPTEDDPQDQPAQQSVKPDAQAQPEIDAETLAAIAGEDKPRMVPHSRFNEVNEEAKTHRARVLELEEELARVKGTAPAVAPKEPESTQAFDFDAAEDRYSAAILDGDQSLAKQIRAEIRKEERSAAQVEAEAAADRRYQANKKQDEESRGKLEFELELSKAYAAHPFLNSESAEPNQDAIEETLVWVQHFVGKGKTHAQALAAAVEKVVPRYTQAAPAAKEPDVAPPKPDLAQGVQRAAQVPARPAGVGERASGIDVRKMSTKDIKGLSAEDEARLAGDMVG